MERCNTCKHWVQESATDYGKLREAGTCQKAPPIWEVTSAVDQVIDDWKGTRQLLPEHAAVLAMVNDGSAYSASLITMPNFSCIQHEHASSAMHTLIGYKNGLAVYVSDTALAQVGEREVLEQLGVLRRYPVKTDLSGNVVMVEGRSHEDAVQRYLNRTIK